LAEWESSPQDAIPLVLRDQIVCEVLLGAVRADEGGADLSPNLRTFIIAPRYQIPTCMGAAVNSA
jgi:hypothetical protein